MRILLGAALILTTIILLLLSGKVMLSSRLMQLIKKLIMCISGHPRRAIIMLGCSASGHEFLAFIWKGVPNGRIKGVSGKRVLWQRCCLYCPTQGIDGWSYLPKLGFFVSYYPMLVKHSNCTYLLLDQCSVHMNNNHIRSWGGFHPY